MGLLEKLFPKKARQEKEMYSYFQTLSGYSPVYTSFDGGLYEMALTRSCIHSFATHCSKLKPEVRGPGAGPLDRALAYKPNPWQDTKKYLYQLATIYMTENTAFITPVYRNIADGREGIISGYYPVLPSQADIVERAGIEYIRFRFPTGTAAVERARAGIMTQFQYRDAFFGENNAALRPTMELINAQNQSIINGVKNSGSVRFLAQLAQALKPEAMKAERDRLVKDNLSNDNGGMMIFDAKFKDIKAIESKPFVVDDKQAAMIRESAFDYFGTNAAILQNTYTPDEWSAYYESKIEPFAIEASLVHTNMTYTPAAIGRGNEILFTVNRVQYMATEDKLNMVQYLFDRGMINQDTGCEILQLPKPGTEDSKKYYIRRDYAEVNALNRENNVQGVERGDE